MSIAQHISIALLAVSTFGCHRSLQIGEPQPYDGGVATDTQMADTEPPDTTPWYVRDQAYVGPELRLPVPAGERLIGSPTVGSLRALEVSAPPDGHLLVANGTRVSSFAASASGPVLETPNGVAVADETFVLLPQRRTAVLWGGAPTAFTREIGGAPSWLVTNGVTSGGRVNYSDTVAMPSATNSDGVSLVQIERPNYRTVGPNGVTGNVRPDAYVLLRLGSRTNSGAASFGEDAYLNYASSQLAADGADWFRVSEVLESTDPWRSHLQVQRLVGELSTLVPSRPSPWAPAALTTLPPYEGRGCDQMRIATGTGTLMIYCDASAAKYVRFASLSESRWLTEWTAITGVPGYSSVSAPALLWDPVATRFVLSLSTGENRVPRASARTQFFAYSQSGDSIATAWPVRNVDQVALVSWQQQVWAVGLDANGFQLFRPDVPGTHSYPLSGGSQTIGNAAQNDRGVTVSWSDSTRTFATRLAFESQLTARSAPVLSVPHGKIVEDEHSNSYIAATSSFVSGAGGAAIARLDTDSLAAGNEQSLPADRGVSHIIARDRNVFVFYGTNYLPSMTPTEMFVSRYDAQLAQQRTDAISPPQQIGASPDCRGLLCAWGAASGWRVLGLGQQPLTERVWREDDLPSFETCASDSRWWRIARRPDGSCAPAPERLPPAFSGFECAVDSERPGESCDWGFDAFAASDTYSLVVEPRGGALNGSPSRSRFFLRLFRRSDASEVARLTLDADGLSGESPEERGDTHVFHLRGGLFALVYSRSDAYRGTREAYARVVYFPEAETVAP